VFTFLGRAVLVVILLVWFIALARRAFVDLTVRGRSTDQQTEIGRLSVARIARGHQGLSIGVSLVLSGSEGAYNMPLEVLP